MGVFLFATAIAGTIGTAIIGVIIVRGDVLFDIAAFGAIFIIVADVVDVISSSCTLEYRRRAHLHR